MIESRYGKFVGKLSQEETCELMRECIRALPQEQVSDVLNSELSTAHKAEIGESWFDIDSEPEENTAQRQAEQLARQVSGKAPTR